MLGALQTVPNQVLLGGTLPATCSQLPQPQDTPALGTKPVRLQGCDSSPAQYVLRGTESECLFYSVLTAGGLLILKVLPLLGLADSQR